MSNELRQDLVSRDWIIIAPNRAGRPRTIVRLKHKKRKPARRGNCPFDDLAASGNWPLILSYPNEKNWEVAVIPNKYPALTHHQACSALYHEGPYPVATGIGHHDLVITRDHNKNFASLSPSQALHALLILQERYRILSKDRCLLYTSSFFNWGASAGASIWHPHYQVLTLPIIPPHVEHSLRGAAEYYRAHGRCVHCVVLAYERKKKTRVIEENKKAISVAPFVSVQPFEMRVFPKRHLPFFEKTPRADLMGVVKALQGSLRRMKRRLNDPDFNFFIHSAPIKNQGRYKHYHWHIEILPKVSIPAGFELSTGVDINVVNPDEAALLLKRK